MIVFIFCVVCGHMFTQSLGQVILVKGVLSSMGVLMWFTKVEIKKIIINEHSEVSRGKAWSGDT